jgi:hypothetical protein
MGFAPLSRVLRNSHFVKYDAAEGDSIHTGKPAEKLEGVTKNPWPTD